MRDRLPTSEDARRSGREQGDPSGPGGKPRAPGGGERTSRVLLAFCRHHSSRPVAIVHKAHRAPVANNEVVQDVDAHDLPNLSEPLGDLEVFLARQRVAAGVVMHQE